MKYLLSFLIIGLLFTIAIPVSFAQKLPMTEAPETLEEAKSIGEGILRDLPEALKKPWQEALAIWGRMLGWFKNIWRSYISAWFQEIWYNINSFLGREVERRKPEIEEEFEKEKQEMKEEIPKIGKSLWQRLKELIK